MQPTRLLLIALALLFAPVAGGASAPSGPALEALRLSLMEGDVQLHIPDSDDWVPAAINTPLRAGDRLWLPAGARAELQLVDGSRVRLNEGSALEILRLEPGAFQFYLSRGQAFVNFRGRGTELLQIDTPPATLRATELAVFRLDVTERGDADLGVFAGRVRADGARERRGAGPGDRLVLHVDGRMALAGLGPTDEWERWNHERDRELASYRTSVRYLPAELESYAYDFDRNGRWVSVAEYGWVWTPQVLVSVGWSPYSHGRWAWIGGDYVWISYDPWGWVPHHYGRWVFTIGIGWCWVPPRRGAVIWAPGWVGWVHRHPHVAWVPLAPGEVYYGHGHYGAHSVNLLAIDIRKTVIKPDYRNARVTGGVIAVTNDNFIRGRTAAARLELNPFRNGEIRPGRPDIAPTRASYAPRPADVPRPAAPPESVRNIELRRLQESRPLVREPARAAPRAAPERRAIETGGAGARTETPRAATPRTDAPRIEAPRGSTPRGERAPEIRAPATTPPTERRIETTPRDARPAPAPAERRIETAPRDSRPAPTERRIETTPREFRAPSAPPSGAPERRPEAAPLQRPESSPRPRDLERRHEAPPESRGPRPRERDTVARPREAGTVADPGKAQAASSPARRAERSLSPNRPEERSDGRAPADIRRGREPVPPQFN